ncbi:MAG: ATP-dependent exonuclease SbcCD, C subunit-like protein [Acidobacteria bacterium]|nr:MAG: ATP-dependent exonuclease SbcCD, C subunit-like protein [Acidobacteriota bacterium]
MHERQALELPGLEDELAGARLHRLELLNWGTFDRQVWRLTPNGKNTLLTGDIGSGKSTLVDAITTLLVPAHRVAYNKAAGADTRERTLRSYVLGYYKSERSEVTGVSKPVPLRDHNTYAVILGVFRNRGYEQTVTLAQVFWITDRQAQPARLFVCAERDLSIAQDFAHFDADIGQLRKKLRGLGAEIFDSFPPYGAWLRRRFGIENDQALELFHQTVSMKSVGNLTDFVRAHMLEPFDVAPRITALIAHFDDLNRAHESVLKAKRQIELLSPLVSDWERHSTLSSEIDELRASREAIRPYFASLKLGLLDKRIINLTEEWERQNANVARVEERCEALREEQHKITRNIAENGGDRLEWLAGEIARKEEERKKRDGKSQRYAELARSVGEPPASDEPGFLGQRRHFSTLAETARTRETDLQNQVTEHAVSLRQGRQDHERLCAEITVLRSRQSNMPPEQIELRDRLCEALSLREPDVPFAGELLQVRDDERDWEGAAERLLRSFGLSLLVPDEQYSRVADWVDRTHLRGRLVYFRLRPVPRADLANLHRDSLVRKLAIKPDSPLYTWLERELANRFDVACCMTQEQFRREARAITRAGQIKAPGERHEKDDRFRLDDRSRYVLGWTNAAKIAALEAKRKQLDSELGELAALMSKIQAEQSGIKECLTALSKLDEYREFRELDWRSLAAEVAQLKAEKQKLESASDVLKQLVERLNQITSDLKTMQAELEQQKDKRSKTEQRRMDAEVLRTQAQAVIAQAIGPNQSMAIEKLDSVRTAALGEHQLTVESCDNRERDMREWMQAKIDAEDVKLKRLRDKLIQAMMAYKDQFKLETADVDASIEAGFEYRNMLHNLQADDLPRFEAKFKELLNENTIREVANFQSQLARERETIKERIAHINGSLTQIDYNPGRYIALEAQLTGDPEIRDFQTELRSCTEGALTGSEDAQYSEAKFLQVKRIVERFRGREGLSELDRRWVSKVTDVRNWFLFAASERWREDSSEYEHYSDSGGKSGGQKEKLAYTILAASLAYQFGLEWGAVRSRSFRFVMIDEAFGRGSDESAQYGLQLFTKLNLQLLIVTPLQKIHVIEPFVSSVGFVSNEEGRESKLRNLSIEEYRAEKAKRSEARDAGSSEEPAPHRVMHAEQA